MCANLSLLHRAGRVKDGPPPPSRTGLQWKLAQREDD